MKTTVWAALVICCSLVCGSASVVLAQCHGTCGVAGCGDIVVRRGHGGRTAMRAYPYGVVAHFPSDGTPLLLPRCTGAHGTLYGRPYNYRNLLDYPWHAPLRGVEAAALQPAPAPAVEPQPFREDSQFEAPAAPQAESFDAAWLQSTDSRVRRTSLQFVR
ncbi:MAG: hypothetical protein OES79_10870 [Planctomycetota bacterium]|nr:hypothetical protein [Planctomycetota bacterium]